jgi:CIDE-N domain
VRAKFGIGEDKAVTFVLESDGCQVDTDDIPDLLPLIEPLMILQNSEAWIRVTVVTVGNMSFATIMFLCIGGVTVRLGLAKPSKKYSQTVCFSNTKIYT